MQSGKNDDTSEESRCDIYLGFYTFILQSRPAHRLTFFPDKTKVEQIQSSGKES